MVTGTLGVSVRVCSRLGIHMSYSYLLEDSELFSLCRNCVFSAESLTS
jgi:hypothetical protein